VIADSPQAVARRAAGLFALAGVLALVGMLGTPGQAPALLMVFGADATVAVLAWLLPWQRWRPELPLVLCVPALAVMSYSTWLFGGFATGTGPFYVLLYAWVGLSFAGWAIAALAVPAMVSYTVPLVLTHQPPQVVTSVLVLVPVAGGIAVVINRYVRGLREARDRIAQAEKWRANLMVTLAHDVRSPLTSVVFALEMLDEEPSLPADRRQAMINTALRQVARIRRLASGLLDVERIDQEGSLKLDLQRVPLRAAADEAAEYVNSPDVVVQIDEGLAVTADPHRLEQILVNLTTNALRHGKPPVVISAAQAGTGVRVEVRDHGDGATQHQQDRLFERFSSSDSSPQSVGLGLWIVAELARAHGGSIHYEPADPGARFVVTLP